MFKTLFLFLALAFAAPAAFAAPEADEITIQYESETMQTNQAYVTKLPEFSYDVPDMLRPDFADEFERAIGTERDGRAMLARAMNVIHRMTERGRIARRYYEVIIGETPSKRIEVTVRLAPKHYGELGYRAYSWATDNKTFDGRDMPTWESLPERIQQAWATAASAIRGAS